MGYSLLLDSSDKLLCVGLSKDGVFFDGVSYEAWQRQSELLIQEIDSLLKKHSLTRKDIDAVVCSKGPGSYTGVRISLTIAKTIAFSLQIPLYLPSSLQVLQHFGHTSICLMNARSKRSYLGVYEGEKAIMEDKIVDNAEAMEIIASHPDWEICGDVTYLGLEKKENDILSNLAKLNVDSCLCPDAFGARPVYLKDDYDKGHFKTIVRKMMPSDLDAVLEIEKESFVHPYERKDLLYELNENPLSHLYCATVDNQIVGFLDFLITFNSATIVQIAVKKEFRRKGIGNLLIGQMLKDCQSQEDPVEFLTLEVRESNLPAQKFYKKHKFENITVKKGYYDDGEDAIYMVRSIING